MRLTDILFVPDDLLMDRVFQPVADRLVAWCDAIDLSRITLISAMVILVSYIVRCCAEAKYPTIFGLGMMLVSLTATAWMDWDVGTRLKRQAQREFGLRNPYRMFRAYQRIIMQFWVIMLLIITFLGGNAVDLLDVGTFFWTLSIHFFCCDINPPRPSRRALALAPVPAS